MTQFVGFAGLTEAQLRLLFSHLLAQDSVGLASDGVLSGLKVSQTATASASVVVGAGSAVAQDTVLAGAGVAVLDSNLTLDVLTANPVSTLPRNDLIVFDTATVSGGSGGVKVIVGTPNASPSDPSVPATAVRLARVRQIQEGQSGHGTIPTARIDDLRAFTSLNLTSAGKYRKAGRETVPPFGTPDSYSTLSVTFATPFPSGSEVVVSAQSEISTRAASVGGVSTTGFTLNVRNLTGSNVTSDTTVTWNAEVATQ